MIWSDTKGLLASAAIGTDVDRDEEENRAYYGRVVTARQILGGDVAGEKAAALRSALPR